MTLAAERRPAPPPRRRRPTRINHDPEPPQRPGPDRRNSDPRADPRNDPERPVELWPTSAIRTALQAGDIATWKRIAAALKRDPYGRTARQVEEVLKGTRPHGITKALWEVLDRARTHLEANERAEVARHVRLLVERSGLAEQEFASRIGVAPEDLAGYAEGRISPSASLMIRIRRLSDRFVKAKSDPPPDAD